MPLKVNSFSILSHGLKTDKIKSFILDEADEMLSRGFKDQIYEIFQYIPESSQVCLFSATMPIAALEMTNKFMNNPTKILVKKEQLGFLNVGNHELGWSPGNLSSGTYFIKTSVGKYSKSKKILYLK